MSRNIFPHYFTSYDQTHQALCDPFLLMCCTLLILSCVTCHMLHSESMHNASCIVVQAPAVHQPEHDTFPSL